MPRQVKEGRKIMKTFITKKEASYRYNLYSTGAGDLQRLLSDQSPQFYHSGAYGWNCDYYVTPFNFVICTGNRPHGRPIPYEITSKYESLAEQIGWEDVNEREKLFESFCKEVREYMNDN